MLAFDDRETLIPERFLKQHRKLRTPPIHDIMPK